MGGFSFIYAVFKRFATLILTHFIIYFITSSHTKAPPLAPAATAMRLDFFQPNIKATINPQTADRISPVAYRNPGTVMHARTA